MRAIKQNALAKVKQVLATVTAEGDFPPCVKENARIGDGTDHHSFLTQPRSVFLGITDDPKGDSFRFGHDTQGVDQVA